MNGGPIMGTDALTLVRAGNGYWRTSWVDDRGDRHWRSFGKAERKARVRFADFQHAWRTQPHVRNPYLADRQLTIRELWERFDAHAAEYYRHPDGRPTGARAVFAQAMGEVLERFGDLRAESMCPQLLIEAREAMIERDLAITTINAWVPKIRQVFRWAAAQSLVPLEVWRSLTTVDALKAGRCKARVPEKVQPAAEAAIWGVVSHAGPVLAAMIKVQYWSGCRPGELIAMRPVDVDVSREVWIYVPTSHKTAHRGRSRAVLLGPKAQEALQPFLARPVDRWCFAPSENIAGQQRHPGVAGERYTVHTYHAAVAYICRRHKLPHWTPNQLRHSAATRVRSEFGLDLARAVLGHGAAATTEIYAMLDRDRASEVMSRIG